MLLSEELLKRPRLRFQKRFREQLTDAASSVPRNVTEGFGRYRPREADDARARSPEHVVLDGNHPLAGIAIRLHLKVEKVREATEDEIGRGSAGTGFFKVQRGAPDGAPLH